VAQTITILDGPLGTELIARGLPAPAPLWSAWAVLHRPEAVASIHRAYASAGATVHSANTFRAKRRSMGDDWMLGAQRAVELARESVRPSHRVAGSLAPLEDCYCPELSPADTRAEHREMAEWLASCGVDIILCETFPHVGEAVVAVEEAVRTGVATWAALTAGPSGELLSVDEFAAGARRCVDAGATACLVNCVAASRTLPFVVALADLGVPFGAYANAGAASEGIGWGAGEQGVRQYVAHAQTWTAAGATLVGGCCGTSPHHIRALREALAPEPSRPRQQE
jgi:S-methylmethionine-dependent homocysteine/selenocysteine methylase